MAMLHKHQQWNPISTWLSRELVLPLWFFNSNHYPQPCKAYSASSFSLRSLWNLRAKLVPECLNLVVEYRNTSQIPSLLFMAFLAALPKGCNSFAGWSSGGKIPGEKYISRTGRKIPVFLEQKNFDQCSISSCVASCHFCRSCTNSQTVGPGIGLLIQKTHSRGKETSGFRVRQPWSTIIRSGYTINDNGAQWRPKDCGTLRGFQWESRCIFHSIFCHRHMRSTSPSVETC